MVAMKKVSIWAPAAAIGSAVLAGDQLSKWWALSTLDNHQIVDLFWTLRLRLVFNTGAAFSQGEGLGPIFAVLVLVVLIVVARHGAKLDDPRARLATGIIAGGAFGNLADRLFRADGSFFNGAVVDFIDLQWWPVFNVADAAVVIGGLLIILVGVAQDRAHANQENQTTPERDASHGE